jgi:ectoine hydroxylase-related dioxygenase (phytanoyl-CoA dioxygenase family)
MSDSFNINLSADQIREFQENGFISLPRITSEAEVAKLMTIFQGLFANKAGFEQGSQFDLVGTDDGGPPKLPQILGPSKFAPELLETDYRKNALAIAKQLLGEEASLRFEHAIYKPAGYGAATPWHQDEAHRTDSDLEYDQISIWMPLQEARLENGCMQYVPRSHLGEILPHHSPNHDPRIMGLECSEGFDPATAIACPLPPGGVTIHDGRTLHYAGPNRSEMPRYAWILAFASAMRPAEQKQDNYWNRKKQTAAQARRKEWENRGGFLGKTSRRVRSVLGRYVKKARQLIVR